MIANSPLLEFAFDLEVRDDWPPAAVEWLYFSKTQNGYRLRSLPFFVPDLSVGDELSISFPDKQRIGSWKHLSRSSRSTLWVMLMDDLSIEPTLEKLKNFGCNIERLPQFNYLAIDVPEKCTAEELDECLGYLNEDRYPVAYPSFRHSDISDD